MRQNGHAQHLRSGQWNSACVATQNGSQRVQLALFRARYGQLPAGGRAPAEPRWLAGASADHRALDGEPSCCKSSTMCIPLWKGALLGVMLSCSRVFHSESNSQTASTVVSALRHSQDSDMRGRLVLLEAAAGGGVLLAFGRYPHNSCSVTLPSTTEFTFPGRAPACPARGRSVSRGSSARAGGAARRSARSPHGRGRSASRGAACPHTRCRSAAPAWPARGRPALGRGVRVRVGVGVGVRVRVRVRGGSWQTSTSLRQKVFARP